jgi:hypothetical protein
MKRLAAHNFKDILQVCLSVVNGQSASLIHPFQCTMPVFKSLFPEDHDVIIQSLLYRFTHSHTLAKLRMHSETTLSLLDEVFKKLSCQLHEFRDITCVAFTMFELPKEKAMQECKAVCEHSGCINPDTGSASGQNVTKFNLNTYKFHTMGDYLQLIRFFWET